MDTLLFKNTGEALVGNALEAFVPFWDSVLTEAKPRRMNYANCFSDEGDSYSLDLEMAGFSKKDVELEISEGKFLVIRGSAKIKGAKNREFTERFQLPKGVDVSAVEASLKDGLLSIKIEKAGESKPVNVTIK